MPSSEKTHHTRTRSVKIPIRYMLKLSEEAQKTGIGKPAVLLRALINEILQSSPAAHQAISGLYEQSGVFLGRPYGDTPEPTKGTTIRFDSKTDEQIQKLLDKHSYGFATLVIGVLEGRYGSGTAQAEDLNGDIESLLAVLRKTVSVLGECREAHEKGLPFPDTDAVCNEAEQIISLFKTDSQSVPIKKS